MPPALGILAHALLIRPGTSVLESAGYLRSWALAFDRSNCDAQLGETHNEPSLMESGR